MDGWMDGWGWMEIDGGMDGWREGGIEFTSFYTNFVSASALLVLTIPLIKIRVN